MNKIGNGQNGEFTFLDVISIISFFVALQNLDLNITQEDVQKVATDFDKRLEESIEDLHGHLSVQDTKINLILDMLEVIRNDSKRNI